MKLNENLVDVYILPLLRLNRQSFQGYFLEAKLTKNLDKVAVILRGGCEIDMDHPFYETDFDESESDKTIVLYRIPLEVQDDVRVFSTGKYSRMSKKSKLDIIKYSGLTKNKTIDGLQITDIRLLGLSDNSKMKRFISGSLMIPTPVNGEVIINNGDIYISENF